MKRHVQTVGVREWSGDDLVELQREPLAALDAFFAEYGPCVVQGCEITARTDDSGTFDVGAGLVALETEDPDGVRRVMTMPFPGAAGVALPLYLTASVETLTDVYGDGKVKPIAYVYAAQASGVAPGEGIPHLALTTDGGNRFVDVVQDPSHRFLSDTDRTRWNSILAQSKAYADSVSATGSEAALRTAKEYTDARETAILASVETQDEATLRTAKEYADRIVAALVDGSPEQLNTLQELAAALGDDPNFSATVMQLIGERITAEALAAALNGAIIGRGWDSDLNTNSVGTGFQRLSEGSGVVGPYVSFGHANYIAQLTVGYTNYQNMANGLKYRTRDGDTGAWNPWNTIWHSGNFDPGKTMRETNSTATDLNEVTDTGVCKFYPTTSNRPPFTYGTVMTIRDSITAWITQLGFCTEGAGMYYRSKTDSRSWTDWKRIYMEGDLGTTPIVASGRVNGDGTVAYVTPGLSFRYDASTKSYSMGFPAIPNPVLQITPLDANGKSARWGKVCCVIESLTTSSAEILMTDSGNGEHIQAGFCFSLISC